MAVYEHTYKQYLGPLTPDWSRFLVIPRHAFRDVFKSKLFIAFFAVCFIPLLVEAILIYLHHNVNALAILKADIRELIPIDASFFETFVNLQGTFAFFVTLLVGPPLVARDLRNNALPLYLCRPFSRTEYVLGKMSVLLILLSLITWIPQLVLFLFQAYLEGASWFVDNLSLASAIIFGGIVWILLLALLSGSFRAREVARDRECRVVGYLFYSLGLRRSSQQPVSDALGKHHQPRHVDEERDGRTIWHVRSRQWSLH